MPNPVLVDTCTLINFAAVERLDLLEATLDGNGRWTEAAAFEISKAAERWPGLWSVDLAGWLGDPLTLDMPGDDRARLPAPAPARWDQKGAAQAPC
ncbi:MAG: hypothetical protein ACRDSP_01310 [Pseudonocardiaceae bacterium]